MHKREWLISQQPFAALAAINAILAGKGVIYNVRIEDSVITGTAVGAGMAFIGNDIDGGVDMDRLEVSL